MRYGISGLPLGLAKGFAGLGVKPVVGALDAITHAGDSVRAIVKHFTQEAAVPVYRQRFSSSFGKFFFLHNFYSLIVTSFFFHIFLFFLFLS
jgi:hypothetical protein